MIFHYDQSIIQILKRSINHCNNFNILNFLKNPSIFHFKNLWKGNKVLVTNSKFLTPISLQPDDGVNLWYLIWVFDLTEFLQFNRIIKGTVHVVLSVSPFQEFHTRFTEIHFDLSKNEKDIFGFQSWNLCDCPSLSLLQKSFYKENLLDNYQFSDLKKGYLHYSFSGTGS